MNKLDSSFFFGLKLLVSIAFLLAGFGGSSAYAQQVQAFQSPGSSATWLTNSATGYSQVKLVGTGAGVITTDTPIRNGPITFKVDRDVYLAVYYKAAVTFRGQYEGVQVVEQVFKVDSGRTCTIGLDVNSRNGYHVVGEQGSEVIIKPDPDLYPNRELNLMNIEYRDKPIPINLNTQNSLPAWVTGPTVFLGRN
jgi:hypothetical protein